MEQDSFSLRVLAAQLAAGGADVGTQTAAHRGIDAQCLQLLLEAVHIGIVGGRIGAAVHPQKNLITRALGVSANIVPEYNRCEIEEGDILLLCTDGLTNMVADDDIAQVLREVPFFDATSILVDRALQAGGQDNITVLLMGVEATEVNNG